MIACATKEDFAQAVGRKTATKAEFKAEVVRKLLSTVNATQSINMIATSAILAKVAEKAPGAAGAQAQQALDVLKTVEGFSTAITIQKDIDILVGVNTMDNET